MNLDFRQNITELVDVFCLHCTKLRSSVLFPLIWATPVMVDRSNWLADFLGLQTLSFPLFAGLVEFVLSMSSSIQSSLS